MSNAASFSAFKMNVAIMEAEGNCPDLVKELKEMDSLEKASKNPQAPFWLYSYCRDVVQGRWRKVEPVIMKSSRWSYWYACEIIRGRWIEAEPVIANNAEVSCWYADSILHDRFKLGEPEILRNKEVLLHYVKHVIEGPWEEAEEVFRQDSYWYSEYICALEWLRTCKN